MTTSWEQRLREDLAALAEASAASDNPAGRALANARRFRRKQATLLAVGLVALAAVASTPVLVNTVGLPFGWGGTVPCERATDEANPPEKTPFWRMPRFVRAFLAELPARDDYYLQSAEGICAFPGYPPHGYAVINLGPGREHGHLTVTLAYHTGPMTCAGLEEPLQETLSCEEGTDSRPLVLAQTMGRNDFVVTAIYPDTRSVSVGAHGTPFEVATILPVVTVPGLVELLPR